ncbi:MAG: DUF2059 domain-containing protein [Planctomycetota bacterium]
MVRLATGLVVFASCLLSHADDPDSPDRAMLASRVAKLVVVGWRRDVESTTANVDEADLPDMLRERLKANVEVFDRDFDWGRVETYVADDYASRYDGDELREIFRFCSSATGVKFIAAQGEIRSKVMRQVVLAKYELPLIQQTKKNIEELIRKLPDREKKMIQSAMDSPGISPSLVKGKWYSHDIDANGNGYRGWHEKKLTGSNVSHGVDINHQDKQYMVFHDEGVWVLMGKVLAETTFEFVEQSNVYIIDSVTPDELTYRCVDPDSKSEDWLLLVDTRTVIEIPKKPAGYKDPFE